MPARSIPGAPLAAAFAAGKLVDVPFTPSFVDGISSPFVNEEMWALAQELVDGSLVVSRAQIAEALRLIVERNRVVPEGAGRPRLRRRWRGWPEVGRWRAS